MFSIQCGKVAPVILSRAIIVRYYIARKIAMRAELVVVSCVAPFKRAANGEHRFV